jgi:hypothetical protein
MCLVWMKFVTFHHIAVHMTLEVKLYLLSFSLIIVDLLRFGKYNYSYTAFITS